MAVFPPHGFLIKSYGVSEELAMMLITRMERLQVMLSPQQEQVVHFQATGIEGATSSVLLSPATLAGDNFLRHMWRALDNTQYSRQHVTLQLNEPTVNALASFVTAMQVVAHKEVGTITVLPNQINTENAGTAALTRLVLELLDIPMTWKSIS